MKIKYFGKEIDQILEPILVDVISKRKKGKTVIIGIQGGQGTGKSTLAKVLSYNLKLNGFSSIHFSIDDFYTSYQERVELSKKNSSNPYYQIPRGLLGTHRTKLLNDVLKKLKAGKYCQIPTFNKSLKNAAGDISKRVKKINSKVNFVLFEGWCLGLPNHTTKTLVSVCKKHNINLKMLDPNLIYSKVVLKYLKDYQEVWNKIDYLYSLQPDSSDLHIKWRLKQEHELKKRTGKGMSPKKIEKFVLLFLPFTYVCYEKIKPTKRIMINKNHQFYKII